MIEILASALARRQQLLRSHAVVFRRHLIQLSDRLFDTIVRRRPRRAAAGFLAAGALAAAGLMVTVHSGNTLSGIAAAHCSGHSNDWTGIYEQNRAVIGANPNLIQPGQHLRIKCTDPAYLLRLGSSNSSSFSSSSSSSSHGAPPPAASGNPSSAYGAFPGAACIVTAESGDNATAQNPGSSASGLFQDLDTTWDGYDGYAHAKDAPVSVQIAFNQQLEATAGLSPWAADGCPGT